MRDMNIIIYTPLQIEHIENLFKFLLKYPKILLFIPSLATLYFFFAPSIDKL